MLITGKKRVASIGKHSMYQITQTKMIPLFRSTSKENKDEEAKYLNIFNKIEITNGFYFSYTYDLTRPLQENIMRKIREQDVGKDRRLAEI